MRQLTATFLLTGLCACTPGQQSASVSPSYLVFFTERSAVLEAGAADVVARAAAAAKAAPDAPVAVLGWTDSVGSAQADVALSQMRVKMVADALVADGVPPVRILRQGRGQTHDDPGVESRRVEVRIGG